MSDPVALNRARVRKAYERQRAGKIILPLEVREVPLTEWLIEEGLLLRSELGEDNREVLRATLERMLAASYKEQADDY